MPSKKNSGTLSHVKNCLCGEGKRLSKILQEERRRENKVGKSVLTLILWNGFLCQEKMLEKLKKQGTLRGERVREEEEVALRLSIVVNDTLVF